uniref:Uncharacterized protein n=1 Tax=Solanum lycopersicum TaxID=4081 RepID=A0A3Q7H7Z5_SOLLC
MEIGTNTMEFGTTAVEFDTTTHIGGGIQHIGAIDEKKDEIKPPTSLYKLIVSRPHIRSDQIRTAMSFDSNQTSCGEARFLISYLKNFLALYLPSLKAKLSTPPSMVGQWLAVPVPFTSMHKLTSVIVEQIKKFLGEGLHFCTLQEVQRIEKQLACSVTPSGHRQTLTGEKEGENTCTDGSGRKMLRLNCFKDHRSAE